MRRRAALLTAVLAAMSFLLGAPAVSRADQLYGITFSNQLITIDPTTGAGSLVGNLDSNMLGYGLAVSNGKLYTYDQNAERIQQIDPATGHTLATININTPNLVGEGDLAFRSDGTGFLSTAGLSGPGTGLVQFDISAPSSSVLSGEPFLFDGLAFNSSDTFYGMSQGVSTGGSKLYTIDQTTGNLTLIGDLNIPAAVTEILGGLTFRSDGTLFAELSDDNTTSVLATVDPLTGQATVIGNIAGFSNVSGLAFLGPNVPVAAPEPSSLVLTGIGFVTVGLARRRRKA